MTISRIPSNDQDPDAALVAAVRRVGVEPILVRGDGDLDSVPDVETPGLALIDIGAMTPTEIAACVRRCSQRRLPVIALVPEGRIADLGAIQGIDDFVVAPAGAEELAIRARRLLGRRGLADSADVIRVGDLAINTASYEVAVGGRRVNLRFKEYELLLLMATTPGRVFTREALLNQIWGYDYLGGTRTVDVHIRRLRSKIEDADHSFIKTVWQVGYRFKSQDAY